MANNKGDEIWIHDFNILVTHYLEFFPTREQTNEERINSIVRLAFYSSIILAIYHSNAKYLFIFVFILCFTFIIYKGHPDLNPLHPKALQQQVQERATFANSSSDNATKLNNFTPDMGITDDMKSGVRETLENSINTNNRMNPMTEVTKIYPENCTMPTVDNPFGNFTMADRMTFDSKGNVIDRPGVCDVNDPIIKKIIDEKFNNNLFKDVGDVFSKMNSQRNYYSTPNTEMVNDMDSFAKWCYLTPPGCKEDQEMCVRNLHEDLRTNRFIFPDAEANPDNSGARQKGDSSAFSNVIRTEKRI